MKILITGNPNYSGLCSGLKTVLYDKHVTYISRNNNYDLTDIPSIVNIAKNFNVFINSTNIPNDGQLNLLNAVYDSWAYGQIINVSTSSVYWNNQKNPEYYYRKLRLEKRSKELSGLSIEQGKGPRVSCIAFGELDTESQRSRNDQRVKIMLDLAANYIKLLIDAPPELNINYLCIDPVQTKELIQDTHQEY